MNPHDIKVVASIISNKDEEKVIKEIFKDFIKSVNISEDFNVADINYYDARLAIMYNNDAYIVLFQVFDMNMNQTIIYVVTKSEEDLNNINAIIQSVVSSINMSISPPNTIVNVKFNEIVNRINDIFRFIKDRHHIFEEKVVKEVEIINRLSEQDGVSKTKYVSIFRYGANILKFNKYLEFPDKPSENREFTNIYL